MLDTLKRSCVGKPVVGERASWSLFTHLWGQHHNSDRHYLPSPWWVPYTRYRHAKLLEALNLHFYSWVSKQRVYRQLLFHEWHSWTHLQSYQSPRFAGFLERLAVEITKSCWSCWPVYQDKVIFYAFLPHSHPRTRILLRSCKNKNTYQYGKLQSLYSGILKWAASFTVSSTQK